MDYTDNKIHLPDLKDNKRSLLKSISNHSQMEFNTSIKDDFIYVHTEAWSLRKYSKVAHIAIHVLLVHSNISLKEIKKSFTECFLYTNVIEKMNGEVFHKLSKLL
jgi:hypothetical protein